MEDAELTCDSFVPELRSDSVIIEVLCFCGCGVAS